MKVTPEQLIRHGEAIDRLLRDESVQTLFSTLEEIYFTNWKAAKTPEERELVWAQASAFGDLKRAFEKTVSVGQDEAHRQALLEAEAANPRNQH